MFKFTDYFRNYDYSPRSFYPFAISVKIANIIIMPFSRSSRNSFDFTSIKYSIYYYLFNMVQEFHSRNPATVDGSTIAKSYAKHFCYEKSCAKYSDIFKTLGNEV